MRSIAVFGDDDHNAMVDDFDIKTMANLIGRPLTDGQFKYYHKNNRPSQKMTNSITLMKGLSLASSGQMEVGTVQRTTPMRRHIVTREAASFASGTPPKLSTLNRCGLGVTCCYARLIIQTESQGCTLVC